MAEIEEPGIVLDSSAVLAYLLGEAGGGVVQQCLSRSAISAVNWSEVIQKAKARGVDTELASSEAFALGLLVRAFDTDDAEATASLWAEASHVSFADRACLALATRLNLPAMTADRDWAGLEVGAAVRLIR